MGEVIGVDLGGTYLRLGIVKGGKVSKYIKEKVPKNKKEILEKIIEKINLLDSKRIKGIGVAVPGFVKNGVVKKTPNLDFNNVRLKEILKKKFKKKIQVENDAKCVTLSELKFGTKKKNFVVLILGTGIGGTIVVNRKLYYGGGYAGELGHMIIEDKKDFEFLWKKDMKNMKKKFGSNFLISEAIKKKESASVKLFEHMYEDLAKGIGSVVSAVDPEEIVLMGGIKKAGKKFTLGIEKRIRNYTLTPRIPQIKWSKIKHPGVLGAGLLVS